MKYYEEDAARKTALTKEMLKKDLLQTYYASFPTIALAALTYALLLSVFKMYLLSLFPNISTAIRIVAVCLYGALAVAVIFGFLYCVRRIIMIKKDRFSIRKEKLVQTVERPEGPFIFKPYYVLHFQSGERYELFDARVRQALMYSKKISKDRICYSDFLNATSVGDVFIVVIFDNRIAQLYNTKSFDLEEDTENS